MHLFDLVAFLFMSVKQFNLDFLDCLSDDVLMACHEILGVLLLCIVVQRS